jgi:hemerythrin-like metal-binding protein
MRAFRWSKSNEVFVRELDDEHQVVFHGLGELQNALHTGVSRTQVNEILHRLIACLEEHFGHEEKLMRGARYLSFDWHRQQHNTVRKRLRHFAPAIEQGDRDAGHKLIEFLSRWLEDHTAVSDRMMGAYLRNQERTLIR